MEAETLKKMIAELKGRAEQRSSFLQSNDAQLQALLNKAAAYEEWCADLEGDGKPDKPEEPKKGA